MSNNEMIPATNYTALKDFNLAEAMASEMNGMDVSFDRVTIPAAGGTTFELPGELPGETDAAKEFTGVILYHHGLAMQQQTSQPCTLFHAKPAQ